MFPIIPDNLTDICYSVRKIDRFALITHLALSLKIILFTKCMKHTGLNFNSLVCINRQNKSNCNKVSNI